MAYDYREAVKADVKAWIDDNGIPEDLGYYDDAEGYLYDTLWAEDSVTGNASGSYTFNRAEAKEYVEDNYRLAVESLREFGYSLEHLQEKIDAEEWEYLDVTIRCYLLGVAIGEVLAEV